MGAITPEERAALLRQSPLDGRYDEAVDRESAYERLQGRATGGLLDGPQRTGPAPVRGNNPWGGTTLPPLPMPPSQAPARGSRIPQVPPRDSGGMGGILGDILTGRGGRREGVAESMAKSVARSMGSSVGRQIGNAVLRGVLGSILKR